MSDRQIAEHVGVSDRTVNRCRAEMESTATMSQSPNLNGVVARTGRDGRTINTANIGRAADRLINLTQRRIEYGN